MCSSHTDEHQHTYIHCTYSTLYALKRSHKNGYTGLDHMANSTWKSSENNKTADNGPANPSFLVHQRSGSEYHFRLVVSRLMQKLCNADAVEAHT